MDIITFMLAGKAIFTVTSKRTGVRFTYRVDKADSPKGRYFVSVLTGPDNMSDYTYAGMLTEVSNGRLGWTHTRGSKIAKTAPSWLGFQWVINAFNAGRLDLLHERSEIHHEGRCGRCGRALTVPESIESGFGPECITKV